jgi:hypothetical protein
MAENDSGLPAPRPTSTIILTGIIFLLLAVIIGGGAYIMGTRNNLPTQTPTPSPFASLEPTPLATATASGSQAVKTSKPTATPTTNPTATPEPTPTPTSTTTPTTNPLFQLKQPLMKLSVIFSVTAATAQITSPSLSPTGKYYSCSPTTFNFSTTITTNAAGTVSYQWLRSDGSTGATKSLVFDAAGSKTTTASWASVPADNYTRWMKLHVLTPNDISSNQASFTISCL